MRLGYLGAVVAALLVATGCGRTWPAVRPLADAQFLRLGGVRTVAVLPIDVSVAAAASNPETPDVIYDRFTATAAGDLEAALIGRGYAVVAPALAPDALAATLDAFARYGALQERTPALLAPDLPARLTGSDATLYVGGFAYSGVDEDGPDAAEIAGLVLIGVFIVVLIVVLAASGGRGGHGGHGGHGSHGGGGVGAHGSGGGGGHALVHAGHHAAHFGGPARATQIEIGVPTATPVPDEGPSYTLLDLTLVDNRTGRTLWHARQDLPANPARASDVHEAIACMVAGLPPAR